MSEVLLGYDLGEPRFVALKFLKRRFRKDAGAEGRLRREADIYRALSHPAVVRLVDDGPSDEAGYFLAQEFLRGRSLAETQEEAGAPLRLHQAMTVLEDVVAALRVAHGHGVIHRDIQPQNLMIGPDGRGTVYDFGIAYAQDDLVRTELGTVMGTLVYAAPEQRRGEKVDHRADVFGVGAVLYEMLTARKAIEAKTFEQALFATTKDLAPPSAANPDVPPALDAICMRLLADEPDARYQDLELLASDLRDLRLGASEDVKEKLFGSREMRRIDQGITAMREGDMRLARTIAMGFKGGVEVGREAEALYLVGLIHRADGRLDLASKCFEKALSIDEENLDVRLDFAMMLLKHQHLDAAARLLDAVPVALRGHLLVLGLMDAVERVREAPAGILDAARAAAATRAAEDAAGRGVV